MSEGLKMTIRKRKEKASFLKTLFLSILFSIRFSFSAFPAHFSHCISLLVPYHRLSRIKQSSYNKWDDKEKDR